jgi:hypothetical protein
VASFGAVRFEVRYVAGYFRYFAADKSYGNSESPTTCATRSDVAQLQIKSSA